MINRALFMGKSHLSHAVHFEEDGNNGGNGSRRESGGDEDDGGGGGGGGGGQMMDEEEDSAPSHNDLRHDFTQQFNSKNAKIIACCIICSFVLYHTVLRLFHGIDTCQWLLSDGNFRDQVWQPYGCMMHHYNHLDARRCMKYMEYWGTKNHYVFVGDSRMEQMYHAFIHQIVPTYRWGLLQHTPRMGEISSTMTPNYVDPVQLAHRDLSYNDTQIGLRVQYLFYPYPNSTMISALHQWKDNKEVRDPPKVLIVGTGSWTIRDSKIDPTDLLLQSEYASVVTHLSVILDGLVEAGVEVLWALQEPTDSIRLNNEWARVTNDKIDAFNRFFQKVLRYSKVRVWSSGRLVAAQNLEESMDGYHLGWKTLVQDAQILLNLYCNDNMNYNDATCCSNLETVSTLQLVTFIVLGISFILLCLMLIRNYWNRLFRGSSHAYQRLKYNGYASYEAKASTSSGIYVPVAALGKLAMIMVFFFICDRTRLFMKENKYFTQTNFWLPVIYILVLGIFFTEDSAYTKVLHFDQDNETKGWMVLLILVYNMMGASQVLPIFMFVKILFSAFLFLHGWHLFLSFVQRGEYSFVRFLQDLFRLNLMTVMLCLCMNRPYQFYDFIPLISFWTIVFYLSLTIPPRIKWTVGEGNPLNFLYLVLKLIGIFCFTTILYMSEVFFEKVFITRPWKALFVSTDDDIHDWWLRWKIDRYSMPMGMVLALGYYVGKKYKVLEDDNHGHLFTTRISLLAAFFSFLGVSGYGVFSVFCRNQQECIEIHSYVAFIPIMGYIIIRNVSGALRTRFSAFFAWFGQFWVELLVGQYHVWMGADGHGVLVLVPEYPVGNVLLTAFVFACTAHEMKKCTEVILLYAVPEDWKKAIRNLILFLLVLIPIGIHDGMF